MISQRAAGGARHGRPRARHARGPARARALSRAEATQERSCSRRPVRRRRVSAVRRGRDAHRSRRPTAGCTRSCGAARSPVGRGSARRARLHLAVEHRLPVLAGPDRPDGRRGDHRAGGGRRRPSSSSCATSTCRSDRPSASPRTSPAARSRTAAVAADQAFAVGIAVGLLRRPGQRRARRAAPASRARRHARHALRRPGHPGRRSSAARGSRRRAAARLSCPSASSASSASRS